MAHECPECGMTCHCNGDIDDICWGEDHELGCRCCEKDDDSEDDYYDDECENCGRMVYDCVCDRMLNCTCGSWDKNGNIVSDCCCGRG